MHNLFGIVCRCLAIESKIISVPELWYLALRVTTDAIGNSQPAKLSLRFDIIETDYEAFLDCLFVAKRSKIAHPCLAKISEAAFSAIMMVGALVFPDTSVGITDASTTRKFWHP